VRRRRVRRPLGVRFDGDTREIEGMVRLATFYDLDGKLLWEFGMSLAEPQRPIVAEKIRALAEAAEVRISGRNALPRNSPLSNVPNNPSETP